MSPILMPWSRWNEQKTTKPTEWTLTPTAHDIFCFGLSTKAYIPIQTANTELATCGHSWPLGLKPSIHQWDSWWYRATLVSLEPKVPGHGVVKGWRSENRSFTAIVCTHKVASNGLFFIMYAQTLGPLTCHKKKHLITVNFSCFIFGPKFRHIFLRVQVVKTIWNTAADEVGKAQMFALTG